MTHLIIWKSLELVLACLCVQPKSLQLWPIPWDPVDCSPPGSSVHGDSPGKILERVAMPSSRGSSQCLLEIMYKLRK